MSQPGHRPVTNRDTAPSERIKLEGQESAPTPRTERITHPGYRAPTVRVRRSSIRLEASAEAASDATTVDQQPLRDVAVASFGQKMMLEVVIGNDDRVRATAEQMSSNPWRQICALRIESQSGKMYVGTGWYIAPCVVATAGHCIFLHDDGGWAKAITVIPAKFGAQEPFAKLGSDFFGSVDGWTEKRSSDFDYGAIFLPASAAEAGTQVGNFEVQALAPSDLRALNAQISGYPADRDRASFQYFHARPLVDVTETRLVYDIDTFGGQSGSPVWQETLENGVIAVGIHTTGGSTSNLATRISEPVLDTFIKWGEDHGNG
jgi:glutamyl endopeptidase